MTAIPKHEQPDLMIMTSENNEPSVFKQTHPHDNEPCTRSKVTFPFIKFLSNFFFVLGAVLYVVLAVEEYRWGLTLNDLPMYVRVATDDLTWVNYRLEERHNESLAAAEEEHPDDVYSGLGRRWLQEYMASITSSRAASVPTTSDPVTLAPTMSSLITPAPSAAVIPAPATPLAPPAAPSTTVEVHTFLPTPQPPPTPEELYYDKWWADLPPEIQAAFQVLGYTEDIWNSGGEVAAQKMLWDSLSPQQQEAALFIGYNEAMWNAALIYSPTISPTEPGGGSGSKSTGNNVTELNWNNTNSTGQLEQDEVQDDSTTTMDAEAVEAGYYNVYSWRELPSHVQEAAAILGYDETLWDTGGYATSENLTWNELSPEQQEAAAVLGYDQNSWDGVDPDTGESVGDDYVSFDDDYVFTVKATNTHVSRYMILYFMAAWCFVFTGALDLWRERHLSHLLMVFAGLFGVASAMIVEKDEPLSNILNLVSVHLFMLDALTLFSNHRREAMNLRSDVGKQRRCLAVSLIVGDAFFVVGATMDVALGYIYVFDETSGWNMTLQIAGIFAACSWLVCGLVYSVVSVVLWRTQSDAVCASEEGGICFDEQARENMMYDDVVKTCKDDGHGYLDHQDSRTRSVASNSDHSCAVPSNASVNHMSNHPNDCEAQLAVSDTV